MKSFYIIVILMILTILGCDQLNSGPVDSKSNIEGLWQIQFFLDAQYNNKEQDSLILIKVIDNVLYWDNIEFTNLQFFNYSVNALSTNNNGWNYHLSVNTISKDKFEGTWNESKLNGHGGIYAETKYVKGFKK